MWGRELFPSPHPAAGVLQGRRKKTKHQRSTTRARFEEESGEWLRPQLTWKRVTPCRRPGLGLWAAGHSHHLLSWQLHPRHMEQQRSPPQPWRWGKRRGHPQVLPQTLSPCPAPAHAGQRCLPAKEAVLPVSPAGGAGCSGGLFPLPLCRASLEASSVEHCSPETVPHSLCWRSPSSLNSPCSFPEPWPGATGCRDLCAPPPSPARPSRGCQDSQGSRQPGHSPGAASKA